MTADGCWWRCCRAEESWWKKWRGAGAARGRRHHGTGLAGHGAEVVDEGHGVEIRAEAAALVPTGLLGVNALEGFAPIFLDAHGHGERQELLKHFGRFDHAIEAVGFD